MITPEIPGAQPQDTASCSTPSEAVTTITPYQDGPLIVRGPFTLTTPDGTLIDPRGATVALCRCGRSGRKPFCDGSHVTNGFTAAAGDERTTD
jgi:CDGSH-type Zn-finger protein